MGRRAPAPACLGLLLCRAGAAAAAACISCRAKGLASCKLRPAYLGPLPWLGPQRSDITLYSWPPSMMMGKKWIWPSGLVCVSCSSREAAAGKQQPVAGAPQRGIQC